MNGIVKAEPRASVTIAMATRFGMDPQAFEATLRATVVPKDCSREQLAAFLLVAKEYSLNPLTKEIYAFPARSGGIQPIVSIDGWLNIINSRPEMDGLEFEDHIEDGKLTAVTARIWRKDRAKPTTVTEYMAECRRATDTWKQWPARMLRHKAAIQCARYAFGFSGIIDPDEYERWQERDKPARAKAPEPEIPDIEAGTIELQVPDVAPEQPDMEAGSEEAMIADLENQLERCTSIKAVLQVERAFSSAIMNMSSDGRELAISCIQETKASMQAEAAE